MMPDFHQEVKPKPSNGNQSEAPVILLENVSKTYGKIRVDWYYTSTLRWCYRYPRSKRCWKIHLVQNSNG